MPRVLLKNEYAEVTLDESTRIVHFRRSTTALASKEAVERFFVELEAASPKKDRAQMRLLIDVREAPSRNDPAFENAFIRFRPRIFGGFERRAVLVKSQVGKLQVNRLVRAAGLEERTFFDEAEARSWLLTGVERERA